MENIYKFSSYKSESIYGFGNESEASKYLEWLNKDREFNLYEMEISDLTNEQADTLAINLRDDLLDLELIDSGDN